MLFVTSVALLFSTGRPGTGQQALGQSTSGTDPLDAVLDLQYNLEYDAAREQLEAWLREHPADLRALNYLASALLHREMFYRGVLGTHLYGDLGGMFRTGKIPFPLGFQQQLFDVLRKAQTLAEDRLNQNAEDQQALYWVGSAHATRAVFYFTLVKSYLAALRESAEARKAHARLLKVNPSFTDAWLVVGINDYVAGSLPWYYKVLASLAGYRGNRVQGLAEVKRVAEQGTWAREDAKFILAILYRREKMYPEMLQLLQGLAQAYPRNFLVQREIAGVYAIQGDLRAAAKIYETLLSQYDSHAPGTSLIPAAKILYEAGDIYVRLGDSGNALAHYERAREFPGDDIYVYRARLAAADLYLYLNRRGEARKEYQRVADAVPDTNEGKVARRALTQFQKPGAESVGGSH